MDTAYNAHFSSRSDFNLATASTLSDDYEGISWQLLVPKKRATATTLVPLVRSITKTAEERFTVVSIKSLYKNKWNNTLNDGRPLFIVCM